MADRTFTRFPKLPLELRNMIWEFTANVPRNIDVWAPIIEDMSFHWKEDDDHMVFKPFRFCTSRPVPSILHVNKESRAIALRFYQLSFDTHVEPGGYYLKITYPATIYLNFDVDRICPMGPYQEDAFMNLWYPKQPPICAVNIHDDTSSPDDPQTFLSVLPTLDGTVPEEIFLYYCEKFFTNAGSFEFVDLTADMAAQPRHWELLNLARDFILKRCEKQQKFEKEEIRKSYQEKGEEAPKDPDTGFVTPRIQFMALVVDGVRQ
jgi:hypothetical protein